MDLFSLFGTWAAQGSQPVLPVLGRVVPTTFLMLSVNNIHGFLHLTLQEYFVAKYINDHQQDAELLHRRADPWWEEVLLLYMGITSDASLFLRQLCSQNSTLREDIFHTNVLLAGNCLAARPTVTETGLRTQIITSLFELLLSTRYSLLKQQAIKVLCGIGISETNRRLVTLLSDERLDVDVRGSIAAALAALAHDISIIAEMTKSLQDERIFDDVFSALWTISRRVGVWIFPLPFTDHKGNLEQSQAQYEIVEWE